MKSFGWGTRFFQSWAVKDTNGHISSFWIWIIDKKDQTKPKFLQNKKAKKENDSFKPLKKKNLNKKRPTIVKECSHKHVWYISMELISITISENDASVEEYLENSTSEHTTDSESSWYVFLSNKKNGASISKMYTWNQRTREHDSQDFAKWVTEKFVKKNKTRHEGTGNILRVEFLYKKYETKRWSFHMRQQQRVKRESEEENRDDRKSYTAVSCIKTLKERMQHTSCTDQHRQCEEETLSQIIARQKQEKFDSPDSALHEDLLPLQYRPNLGQPKKVQRKTRERKWNKTKGGKRGIGIEKESAMPLGIRLKHRKRNQSSPSIWKVAQTDQHCLWTPPISYDVFRMTVENVKCRFFLRWRIGQDEVWEDWILKHFESYLHQALSTWKEETGHEEILKRTMNVHLWFLRKELESPNLPMIPGSRRQYEDSRWEAG